MGEPGEGPSLDFFEEIEDELNVKIPGHLKKLLTLHGYANNVSMANLSESDVTEIERFTRSDLKSIIKEDEIVAEYVGIFTSNVSGFLIFGGDKKLLFSIKEHVHQRTQNAGQSVKKKAIKKSSTEGRRNSQKSRDKSPELAIENLDEERKHLTELIRKNFDRAIALLDENTQQSIQAKRETINCNIAIDNTGNLFSAIKCCFCKQEIKVSA